MRDKSRTPFTELGTRLKKLREKNQENLAEVAGAVEIDMEVLSNIEAGAERPSEDILLLLISHFGIKEEDANKLWVLAGYDQAVLPANQPAQESNNTANQSVMVMPVDARVMYTDMVHVMVNNYGVVINFMQATGTGSQPLAVARVGMSKEHAKSVLEVLTRTLDQSEQKILPASTVDHDSSQQIKRSKKPKE